MKLINKVKKFMVHFSEMPPAAKASIVLMMTQMIQKGLSVLTSPIYTRLLTTEEYGQVSLFFSWYEILIIFTGFCLAKGVFNNGMLEYRYDRDGFSWSLYTFAFYNSIIIGCGIILFCKCIYNFIGLPIPLIIYMFVLLVFEEALSIWTVRQRFEYKYKASAIVSLSLAILSPICGIISIFLFNKSKVYARIIGARSVFLIVYIILAIYLAYKAKGKVKFVYWKYAIKFNLPLIPHYLSLHILNHMDRIMIASLDSSTHAGIYSVAYNGASIVKLFWQSVNASLIPWTYEKCEKKEYESLANVVKVLIFSYGMICIFFMFLAPEVMKILAPSSYQEGIYILPSIIAGVFFAALYYIFANVVYYYKKPKYVMIGSCCSALVNVILNAIFIPIFGYMAAGYTTLFSYLLQAFIDYIAMKKVVKEKIYDIKFIIKISVCIIIMGITLSFIYEYILLRLVILLGLSIYMYRYIKNNKEIYINLLKKRNRRKTQ